jgi:hypothetical protein
MLMLASPKMGAAYGFVQIGALRIRKCLIQEHLNKN